MIIDLFNGPLFYIGLIIEEPMDLVRVRFMRIGVGGHRGFRGWSLCIGPLNVTHLRSVSNL